MKSSIETALESLKDLHTPFSTYVVGMSGGVDSSVSAFLLKEAGFHVIGVFMKNWEETTQEGACTQEDDFRDVVSVANLLQIPYYSVNFTKEYQEEVFKFFLEDIQKGLTPNPDILCNREIKFKKLLEKALHIGGGGLATGHYAKIRKTDTGLFTLECPKDNMKDQTYFLYTASQKSLASSLFPLANLTKKEVRAIAQEAHLPVHNKKDSTGICFIGKRNFRSFLSEWIGTKPGPMITDSGLQIGTHMGLAFYTIGQRKGLQIGGKGDAWFVADKRLETNELIVVQGENNPLLFKDTLSAKEAHWITYTPTFPFECTAKIRYRQPDQRCIIEKEENGILQVRFFEPQRAITPQQSIVFYQGEICLGGGIIVV
jgi:tRNA-specific 2-thiouridylase